MGTGDRFPADLKWNSAGGCSSFALARDPDVRAARLCLLLLLRRAPLLLSSCALKPPTRMRTTEVGNNAGAGTAVVGPAVSARFPNMRRSEYDWRLKDGAAITIQALARGVRTRGTMRMMN